MKNKIRLKCHQLVFGNRNTEDDKDILKHDNKLQYLLNLADSALWKCVSMYVHSKGGMWMPEHKTEIGRAHV